MAEICRILEEPGPADAKLLQALDTILGRLGCTVGTIHALDAATQILELRAHRGIPGSIFERVRRVPVGKGMAGLAAERRMAVQVCNLQTDESGVARPAAKETGMRGSIAVPVLDGEVLLGTLGVGKSAPYDFSEEEAALLGRLGVVIGRRLV